MLMSESKALSNQSLSAVAGIFNSIFNLGGDMGSKVESDLSEKTAPPSNFRVVKSP